MDARQLAFLDAVEDDLTTPKTDSTATAKRIGALGAVLAAGTAFFALSAGPASAAPASAAPATNARAAAAPAAAPLPADCWAPIRQASDYTKGCGNGAYMKFHYVGSNPCGPGGQRSILYFQRTLWSPCAGGDVDAGLVATSCA